MIPSPPPQPPRQQPPAVVVTGKTLLDEDARTAIVSDGHSPDVFDMSTAGSGSCGGPPLATRPTDIPRHIETPTQKTLPTTTTTPWMDRKIPKKNCKTTVQQITRPSEHDASDVAQETDRVPPAAEETSTLSIDGPDVTPQRKEFLDAGVAPGNETSVTQTEKILVDAEEVQFHTLQQAEPHAAVDLVEHSAMADDSPLATPETSPDSSSAASPPSTASKAEYRRVQIGARVSVYWDGEDEFFDATVTAERPGKKKRFYLEYDDGDEEWINLRKHTWRLLSGGKAKCKVAPSAPLPETETSRPAVDDNKVEVIDKAAESPVIKEDTKAKESIPTSPQKKTETTHGGYNPQDWMHDDDWVSKGAKKSDSDSETDDEEVTKFARKMLGVEKHPIARPKKKPAEPEVVESPPDFGWEDLLSSGIHIPISEKVKGRRRSRAELYTDTGETAEAERVSKKKKRPQKSACRIRVKVSKQKLAASAAAVKPVAEAVLAETASADPEEANRRKKEEARMLTADEVKAILGEEDPDLPCSSHNWVRRSARMPSRSVLDTPKFKLLIEKLKTNDPDMVVLKMKKYLGDPNCPQICIDTVLDALEENTNCQSLYIQNFNEGMRDKQVLRLLQILQKPSCNIWCLNIGETYNVKTKTWKAFTRGLKKTKITHMYASEHTISSELKERIRKTIRENRKKHTMHIDPENLDVIVKVRTTTGHLGDATKSSRQGHLLISHSFLLQCTHCWWNPINAKVLRPHLHRKGYAHILSDKAAQGLRGTDTGASLA